MKSLFVLIFSLTTSFANGNQCRELFNFSRFLNLGSENEVLKDLENEFLDSGDMEAAAMTVGSKWQTTKFEILKAYARGRSRLKESLAKNIYRPILEFGKHSLAEFGTIYRAYFLRQAMDLDFFRWHYVETLHEKGKDAIGFGSHSYPGLVQLMTRKQKTSSEVISKSQLKVGVSNPWVQGAMVNISGMSYPQLSAHAVMSLIYAHIKLAKSGIRNTMNTGEGGANFHLALLSGNLHELRKAVVAYEQEANGLRLGSLEHAKLEVSVEELFRRRNELFSEFSSEDMSKAQIIYQIGSGLNGVRTADGGVDYDVLRDLSRHPNYAGTQIKLRQAAKQGASVDAKKINPIAAYIRGIRRGTNSHVTETPDAWSTPESLAQTILNVRAITQKPVSIKFAISDINETYVLLKTLRDSNALPDHIQLDGSGWIRQPGTGNGPLMGNSARNIAPATIILNTLLKKLGIREKLVVESSGDVETPNEAMMLLSMGADVVGSARLWMGMTLGCRRVQKCNSGACPYGITSADGSIMTLGLDPKTIGSKGFTAAKSWQKDFSDSVAKSGVTDWQRLYQQIPFNEPNNPLMIRTEYDHVGLADIFPAHKLVNDLAPVMNEQEANQFLIDMMLTDKQ
ncbi:MAG: hypothetical protein A4S09_03245 [Proteobacteria bacterium SG_bin7]|nr:MAG: hypothetical protein A4S09_03245 [Proteobacteria bacterium SG_bin7]